MWPSRCGVGCGTSSRRSNRQGRASAPVGPPDSAWALRQRKPSRCRHAGTALETTPVRPLRNDRCHFGRSRILSQSPFTCDGERLAMPRSGDCGDRRRSEAAITATIALGALDPSVLPGWWIIGRRCCGSWGPSTDGSRPRRRRWRERRVERRCVNRPFGTRDIGFRHGIDWRWFIGKRRPDPHAPDAQFTAAHEKEHVELVTLAELAACLGTGGRLPISSNGCSGARRISARVLMG